MKNELLLGSEMAKDSINSYEQKKWASTVARHTKLKEMLSVFRGEGAISFIKEWIAECEAEYPQLKCYKEK